MSGSAPGYDFWRRQLRALGEKDPLEVLEATPDQVEVLVEEHSPDAFAVRPDSETWSPVEVLGHLLDVEWVFGFRCRTSAYDQAPTFPGIDQERWVAEQEWADADPRELARRFRKVREVNLAFWRSLGRKDLEKTGLHGEADVVLTLGEQRSILAGHDLVHLEQMEERLG